MNEYDLIVVGARCATVSDGDDPRQAAASGESPEWLTRAIVVRRRPLRLRLNASLSGCRS